MNACRFVLVVDDDPAMQKVLSLGIKRMGHDVAVARNGREAIDMLGLGEDEVDELEPAGDTGLLEEFGISGEEIELICSDEELYPDEQLTRIAERLGISAQWTRANR